MKMYRCTRNKPYIKEEVPGTTKTKARQGHFVKADSVEEALAEMAKKFPDEVEAGFTAEEWNDD